MIPKQTAKTLKHAKSTLDDRYTLVEHVIDASHTRWAHVECPFDKSVRVHTRYERVGRTLLIRYQHDDQSFPRR